MKKASFIIIIGVVIGIGAFYKFRFSSELPNKSDQAVGIGTVYSHPDGTFSFKYPEGLKVSAANSEDGEILTAEADSNTGFQIFITPFDEPDLMTPERIKKDLPDAIINEPAKIIVGGEESLAFYGSADIGETYEVWAVHDGKLYQIMTHKNAKDWLEGILKTWEWK